MEFWVGFAFHLGLWGFFVDFWCFGGFFEEGVVWFGFWGFFTKFYHVPLRACSMIDSFTKKGRKAKK